MGFVMRIAAVLLGLAAAQPLLAQTGPVKVQGVVELSGTGATSGTNFNDGEATAITQQGNPYIFRTSLTQTTAMPSAARSRPRTSSWRRTSRPIRGCSTSREPC